MTNNVLSISKYGEPQSTWCASYHVIHVVHWSFACQPTLFFFKIFLQPNQSHRQNYGTTHSLRTITFSHHQQQTHQLATWLSKQALVPDTITGVRPPVGQRSLWEGLRRIQGNALQGPRSKVICPCHISGLLKGFRHRSPHEAMY